MSLLLTITLFLLAILLVIWLHTGFWTKFFTVRRAADQVHVATTSDGWNLALHHFLPPRKRFLEPIFLCHGLGANRFNFDLVEYRSLARELCQRGFDVWLVELRGSGHSSKPGWFSPYRWGFDFDDHLNRDIPAALKLVRGVTGGGPVFWVGHSMGGMLGYAWLGRRGDHGVKGLVAISAPVLLAASRRLRLLRPLARLLAFGQVIRFRPISRFLSPFLGWLPGVRFFSQLVVYPPGIEGALLRRCMVNLVENSSGALIRQFLRWIQLGAFCSRDGAEDYLANLGRIEEPVLIIGAERDQLVPPETVAPAYERIGAEDKQIHIFGTDRGDDFDFGHGDILLGSAAREVIYPEISKWLCARATRVREKEAPIARR